MARVLVLDDDPDYRDGVRFILASYGYEVETAETGSAAREVARRFRPEVLVVDWRLADGESGLDVTETMRPLIPDLRPILITGCATPELHAQTKARGILAVLEKPFEPLQLLEVVRQCTADESGQLDRTASAARDQPPTRAP